MTSIRNTPSIPDRFEVWCGFDYTGYDKPDFGPAAVKELVRCYKVGARGVGELGDRVLRKVYRDNSLKITSGRTTAAATSAR